MSEHISRPSIFIEPGLEPEREALIRNVDRIIHERPARFVNAIEALQSKENGLEIPSLDLREARSVAPNIKALGRAALPQATVLEMMRLRFDFDYEYDDPTENAFIQDEAHRKLLRKPKDLGVVLIKTGVMRSETRAHPNAAPVREQIRLDRLRMYAGRIAQFKSETRLHRDKITGGLRSTG